MCVLPWVALVGDGPGWVDEVFYAEPARELALHGRLSAPMFGEVRGLSEAFALQPPGAFVERAAVYRIFGFAKRTVRLASLFDFAACLLVVFVAVERAAGRGRAALVAATLATAVFACDSIILKAARSSRPDLLAVSLALMALVCATESIRRPSASVRLSGLTGLLAGAAASVHPVMLAPAAGLACGTWVAADGPRRNACTSAFFAGGLVGIAPWAIHVATHAPAWRTQFLDHATAAFAGGSASIERHPDGLLALARPLRHLAHLRFAPLAALALVGGIVLVARSASRHDRLAACVGGASFLPLFAGESFAPQCLPLLYVVAAMGWSAAWVDADATTRRKILRFSTVATLAALPVWGFWVREAILDGRVNSDDRIARVLADHVPRGSIVVAESAAYFAALEVGDRYLVPHPLHGLRYARTPEDERAFVRTLAELRPRYFLLDAATDIRSVRELPDTAILEQVARVHHDGDARRPSRLRDRYDLVLWSVTLPQ